MRAGFDILDRNEKIRISIFTIITVIVTVFAALYVWEWCGLFEEPLISMGDGDIIIDGENFNWFFDLMASGMNGLLILINGAAYIGFLFVMDLLAYGLFRAFAFRKTNFASEAEHLFAKRVLAVILIVGIVISLLLARFRFLIFITLLIFPIWLFGYLFYILPLKHRREK